jgi:hypothetical protein
LEEVLNLLQPIPSGSEGKHKYVGMFREPTMTSAMRDFILIVENAGQRSIRQEAANPTAYDVVQYDGPKHVSSTIVNKVVIRAATKAELQAKIKSWMEQIGLDPEDEDDLSYINWKPRR